MPILQREIEPEIRASQPLAGKCAVITGAARGLGRSIARNLSEAGAHVLLADVRAHEVQDAAGELRERGAKADALALDLCSAEGIEDFFLWAGGRSERLDILVNNAAVDKTAPLAEISAADWDRIIETNLRAPFLMMKRAFPLMERQGGHIVNIVSTASKRAWANASAYHASKWGLLGLSHALHVEGRPKRIKVTAIIAGGMRTPFLLERFPDIDPNVLQDAENVAAAVRFVLTQPRGTVIPEIMVLPEQETSWP